MRKSGITVKLRKCRFALSEVKFCGQLNECGERSADPEKLEADKAIKIPETKKQVRQLMGFLVISETVFRILRSSPNH